MNEKKLEEEFEVFWSDQVKEQAATDPKMAEVLREFGANARQDMAAVKAGQYETFDEAIFAITGSRPKPVDEDLDDY